MPDLLEFVSPDGTVTNLAGLPGVRALGDAGLDLPPFSFVEDDVAQQAGAQLRTVRVRPRDVTVPVYISDVTELGLRTMLRGLALALAPTSGQGKLRVTSVDGTQRELRCRYADGLTGNRTKGASGAVYRLLALVFRAHDPYLYDAVTTSQTYTTGTPSPFLSSTFLPMQLASDVILGTQTVVNGGDVEAWPRWTVRGPASSVTLSNTTTGATLTVSTSLLDGQSLVIDTTPLVKTVRRDDGSNLYGSLTTSSSLWSLARGNNVITVTLPGATTSSFVTLSYERRWLTA